MARSCTVCQHPAIQAINAALVGGASCRELALIHSLSPDALERHRAAHLPKAMAHAQEAADVAHGDDLLGQVRTLQTRALTILDTAEGGGDLRTALGAIREARGCLELLARLLGELSDQPVINLLVSPEWHQTRAVILQALAPHADARLAVAAALTTLESTTKGESS